MKKHDQKREAAITAGGLRTQLKPNDYKKN